ncbi:transcription factor GTE1-like isoform X2 [Lotus japonicus]|nr:transcription factor GTE1-like isoform X2 [Lotus japonicus]
MDPNFGASCSNVTEENLNRYRHFVNEILTKVQRLEKQVNEVEQFYNPTDGVQVNHYKGRGMHLSGTKKSILQGGSSREVLGMQELMHRFETILDEITQDRWAEPFLEPVDVKGLDLYDYYEIIEKPMDFSTIRRKMDAKDGSGYKNVREIYSDVRLIFKNAMKYNDRKHDIHVMAKNLLEKFEKKWLQLLPKVVEAESERLAEERLNAHIAQEANCANMAREISFELGEVDTDLKNLKAMVIENCRKLSAQEKVTLGTALTKLSHENLMRAMQIISENNPNFQPDVEEVNLDIDAQSDYTLWRLNIFAKSALEVQGRTHADTVANHNSNVEEEERSNKRRRV